MSDRPSPRPPVPGKPAPSAAPAASPDQQQSDPAAAPQTYPYVERRKAQRERRAADPSGDGTGLERRRGPGRRLTDFIKAAEEGEMNQEQFLFLMAIDAFKRSNNVMYPTWTDVLEVVRLLGYRKTMPSELRINNAEDWSEPADAPSKVRSKPGHPEAGGDQVREAA